MFRSLLECDPAAIVIEQPNSVPQLPTRFYVYGYNAQVGTCAGAALPAGYRLDEGERPIIATGG